MLNGFFDCPKCGSLLTDPIVLPCGETICQMHLSPKKSELKCQFCNGSHLNQSNRENKLISRMIRSGVPNYTKVTQSLANNWFNISVRPRDSSKLMGHFGMRGTSCLSILLQTVYFYTKLKEIASKINTSEVLTLNFDLVKLKENLANYERIINENNFLNRLTTHSLMKFMNFNSKQDLIKELSASSKPGLVALVLKGEMRVNIV